MVLMRCSGKILGVDWFEEGLHNSGLQQTNDVPILICFCVFVQASISKTPPHQQTHTNPDTNRDTVDGGITLPLRKPFLFSLEFELSHFNVLTFTLCATQR